MIFTPLVIEKVGGKMHQNISYIILARLHATELLNLNVVNFFLKISLLQFVTNPNSMYQLIVLE